MSVLFTTHRLIQSTTFSVCYLGHLDPHYQHEKRKQKNSRGAQCEEQTLPTSLSVPVCHMTTIFSKVRSLEVISKMSEVVVISKMSEVKVISKMSEVEVISNIREELLEILLSQRATYKV